MVEKCLLPAGKYGTSFHLQCYKYSQHCVLSLNSVLIAPSSAPLCTRLTHPRGSQRAVQAQLCLLQSEQRWELHCCYLRPFSQWGSSPMHFQIAPAKTLATEVLKPHGSVAEHGFIWYFDSDLNYTEIREELPTAAVEVSPFQQLTLRYRRNGTSEPLRLPLQGHLEKLQRIQIPGLYSVL